jgi:hypothetical protein
MIVESFENSFWSSFSSHNLKLGKEVKKNINLINLGVGKNSARRGNFNTLLPNHNTLQNYSINHHYFFWKLKQSLPLLHNTEETKQNTAAPRISALPSSMIHHKKSKMISKATTRTTRSRKTAASLASLWLVAVITHTCLPVVVVHSAPIGASCQTAEDCDTGRCFVDKNDPVSPMTCECNADTNAGCEGLGLTCADHPITSLKGKPACLRPLGNICANSVECASFSCRSAQCDCSLITNDCPEGEKCIRAVDSVPTCYEKTDLDLELGKSCVYDFQCASVRCYKGKGGPPSEESPGVCACNPLLGALGKGDDMHACPVGLMCSDVPTFADGDPTCRLPTGSSCTEDNECASNECFNQEECAECSIDLAYGCEKGQACTASTSKDGPPVCIEEVVDPVAKCDPPCGKLEECIVGDVCLMCAWVAVVQIVPPTKIVHPSFAIRLGASNVNAIRKQTADVPRVMYVCNFRMVFPFVLLIPLLIPHHLQRHHPPRIHLLVQQEHLQPQNHLLLQWWNGLRLNQDELRRLQK